jgi:cytochrome b pre-mRNA-processing protein 3
MPFTLFRKREVNPAAMLYDSVVRAARLPDWYRDAGVPDTIDGRYCVLATLLALTDLRLAEGDEAARALSPRLTELFVGDLDVQLRESGLGDPTLGKTVRNLVTGLSGRIGQWRTALESDDWSSTIRSSLYRDQEPDKGQAETAKRLIGEWNDRLSRTADEGLREGVGS